MSVSSIAKKGFTLVELLIVIAILAVLAAAVVIVLNPAELLAQSRDSQRLSDMDTLKNAVAVYISQATTPALGTCTGGGCCMVGTAGPFTNAVCVTRTGTATDGAATNWIDINFNGLPGGSPIPYLPKDPSNTATYFYSYANTASPTLTFEIDCALESSKYAGKEATDGGNAASWYEVGTDAGLDL
jgi:prepilin-type N-terminal cleavage/methylation domain-containing protein